MNKCAICLNPMQGFKYYHPECIIEVVKFRRQQQEEEDKTLRYLINRAKYLQICIDNPYYNVYAKTQELEWELSKIKLDIWRFKFNRNPRRVGESGWTFP